MMLHVPAVLNGDQVADLRAALDRASWVDGRASVGSQGAQVKHNHQLAEGSPLALQLGQAIVTALHANPLFFSAVLPHRILPPFFNRYGSGEHYGLHVDGAIRTAADNGQRLRSDVSCTLFLTEPEDYDGGELVVVDTYGTHEVKLPAGDLIVYPASSLHRVEPVTRGVRVSSFFWVQSMVREDWHRTMLFDLDQNIQKLRQRIGDCEETVGLTGHYHNLLRQWAEV
ncbi:MULTISPECIES: Fe2+-dependent dioxygenase [unclassified Methylibium]|uniref:Fe2+-dependent dioxygenase n=1 Tax=unclassified Methylibium TaxID=2633235 RepID=UPI0003F3F843|nr:MULTISPECIES: Fe2+-dependent dioxygenase [unclassified Methylibium]EWS53194.1 PKHD-type hydroxylase [Methylibium sp. T29]EWS58200.1 PKHD-type hydroxylase [Methylibium sp. T29-B]